MNTTKKPALSFLFVALALTSCGNQNMFVAEHKNAWFSDPDKGLLYCKANEKTDGSADPTCFETAFQRYEPSEKFQGSKSTK